MTSTITVRDIEYPFVSGEAQVDPASKIIWSLLKIISKEAYESALETKDPISAWKKATEETQSAERDSAFFFALNLEPDIESDASKNPRVALERNLRKLIPTLPSGLGATELLEFINAVLPSQAEEAAQPEKKSVKKKGFNKKAETEVPTLEAIAGREITPEDVAAVKEGNVEAVPPIPLATEELVKLRPDLLTIEEQDLRAAIAEQEANRLTVVSVPAPPDSDELEDLI